MGGVPLYLNQVDKGNSSSQLINSIYFKKLWGLNYLKYSNFAWSLITSEKFNNQNRLRECEFLKLIESAGLNTIYIESLLRKDDIKKLKNFPLSKRFRKFTVEEVAVIASKIISSNNFEGKMKRIKVYESWLT